MTAKNAFTVRWGDATATVRHHAADDTFSLLVRRPVGAAVTMRAPLPLLAVDALLQMMRPPAACALDITLATRHIQLSSRVQPDAAEATVRSFMQLLPDGGVPAEPELAPEPAPAAEPMRTRLRNRRAIRPPERLIDQPRKQTRAEPETPRKQARLVDDDFSVECLSEATPPPAPRRRPKMIISDSDDDSDADSASPTVMVRAHIAAMRGQNVDGYDAFVQFMRHHLESNDTIVATAAIARMVGETATAARSLAISGAWRPELVKQLDAAPLLTILTRDDDDVDFGVCDVCHRCRRRSCTIELTMPGRGIVLEAGAHCAHRVRLYHELFHFIDGARDIAHTARAHREAGIDNECRMVWARRAHLLRTAHTFATGEADATEIPV